ncbi:choice-of-anchor P family protein [Amycolatopsis sp. H20-H5]|uniref:choice-of-anchor P family protein n=1 Tax=Amycolatopsis sp. H20-H5 TaxID=3046309 RepID=UPI002DBC6A8C|nr:choice-of-anchor P family protein [Amycolatopsis sp. H20-H5]MEC3975123.1 choice-of-anchor P family protein [Amycolatopsis sp. H20-H5]
MFPRNAFAGSIGLCAAVLVAGTLFAPVAGAAEHPVSSAYALSATGLLKVGPVPFADGSDGFDQKSLAELSLPLQLVKVNVLNAQAGDNEARASIKDVSVGLNGLIGGQGKPLVSVSAIEAECKGGKASSSLAKARIGDIKLDVAAAPNTGVVVPGLASVLLNKQVKHKDGSFTVTALSISVDGIQTLDLASATCAEGGGEGSTPPGSPEPTEPTKPGKPTSTKPSVPATTTGTGDKPAGDKPDANGKAPAPTPAKAHLDVTG